MFNLSVLRNLYYIQNTSHKNEVINHDRNIKSNKVLSTSTTYFKRSKTDLNNGKPNISDNLDKEQKVIFDKIDKQSTFPK